jgi:hypothetical protein
MVCVEKHGLGKHMLLQGMASCSLDRSHVTVCKSIEHISSSWWVTGSDGVFSEHACCAGHKQNHWSAPRLVRSRATPPHFSFAVHHGRNRHPSVASCIMCTSQLRHIDVLVVVFDMLPATSQRQQNVEAGFWVSKINPKPKDALRHQLLVPERGALYELRFGLPRLVKIQVPKPCCSQSGDTTLRD